MANKSLLSTTPSNTSLLQPQKFVFVIPTLNFVKFFCQSVTIPSLGFDAIEVPTPFVATYRHGSVIKFGMLSLTLLMDEDLQTYQQLYTWIHALSHTQDTSEYTPYKTIKGSYYHDGILTSLTNANVSNVQFHFRDLHPVSLSEIKFDTTAGPENPMICSVDFRFDYFTISNLRS